VGAGAVARDRSELGAGTGIRAGPADAVDATARFPGVGAVRTTEVEVDTSGRRTVDLTPDLLRFCAGSGDGLVNAFVPHATAGLALMETGSGSEEDLLRALERLLPRDERYGHAHGSRGHGADHLLPALVSPSVTIPVLGGRPAFGTWQSLVLVDLNVDNPRRRVRFSFVPDGEL
jgi:secondary thiamine-phosphate synthase enzyme